MENVFDNVKQVDVMTWEASALQCYTVRCRMMGSKSLTMLSNLMSYYGVKYITYVKHLDLVIRGVSTLQC